MPLVEEVFNQKIYKVKHVHSPEQTDYDTYIFVGGHYNDEIYTLLKKIENDDYTSLNDEENKKISIVIPNFRAKFGKIITGKTFFVKDLIFDHDSINIIRMKISYYLNSVVESSQYIGIHQQHLWIKTHNIDYKNIIKFVNHLMGKTDEVSLADLIIKLQVILDLNSQKDIENLVKELFYEKYKNKPRNYGINLFNNNKHGFYTADNLINDEEFIALLNHKLIVIGRDYKKQLMVSANNYIDYPLYIVANPFSNNVSLSDKIIMDQWSDQYSKILSEYGLIDHNLIYLVTYQDFISNYKGHQKDDIVNLFWDTNGIEYLSSKIKSEKESVIKIVEKMAENSKDLFKLTLNRIENPKKFESLVDLDNDYLVNSVVIGINDPDNPNTFAIEQLFNVFETDNNVPFVKYVINEYSNNYKIFKPFLKKHSFKFKIIASWKNVQMIPDVVYPVNKKYLVFKLLLREKSEKTLEDYVSISIYENGYIIINFNLKKYISIKEVKDSMEDISDFIQKIIKITDSKIIYQPESNVIFKSGLHPGLLKTKILGLSLKTKVEFKNQYKLSLDQLNSRLENMQQFFYTNYKNNVIKILYKKVSNFDGNQSIINFINKLFESNKKIFDGHKTKYIELLESIFLINRIKAKEIIDQFNPQSVPENIKYHFLYGVDITLSQEKDKFIIVIDNLHQINQINFIHNLLYILFDPNFNLSTDDTQKESKELDLNFDLEQKPLIIEGEQQADIGFDFDELGFDDMGLELDKNLEEEFKKEKELEKAKEEEKLVVDYDIKKKGTDMENIKFTNYMAQMREKADPGLYKVEDVGALDKEGEGGKGWKYGRKCDSAQMRQPYIISKENLDKIKDPSAITGYIKYRDHYYICPRIWDYKAEMPISVDEFIKHDQKSPYTKGKPLPYDKRNKEFLNDKHTVIIRRPTSEAYWSKENVEKDWPEILKNTGADAFPGFMKPKDHPKNLCVPCCFLKEPEDYKPNSKEVQAFKKPVGYEVCDVQQESEIQKTNVDTKEFDDNVICKNENYIKTDITTLDNCRYGLLPDNLNILLRNYQEFLISSATNSLHKYTNCFLRRGVFSDKNSFLRSIASIKESISTTQVTYKKLINLIVENLTPEIFITLNQGSLINIFKFSNNLPKNRSQLYYFSEFTKKYPDFVNWLGIDDGFINSIDDIIKLQKNQIVFRKIKKLFTVFSAFYNFIKYCQDDKIIKKHEFFLDLIGRKLDWLFPKGANIIIFSKETNNIFCNPYITETNKPLIMLLYDDNGKFEPIFHVQSKSNLEPKGIINLNHDVNISTKNLLFFKNYIKNQTININVLKDTQKRLPVLKALVNIHISNCSELPNSKYGSYKILPTSVVVYNQLKLMSHDHPGLNPTSQITSPLHTTEFIITANKMAFPVRPSTIILDLPVYDTLEYFDLVELDESKKMLSYLNIFNTKTSNSFYYKPKNLIVADQNVEMAIGILLENEGLIPIYPTSVDTMLEEANKLGLNLSIVIKNIYYEADYTIYDNQIIKDDRIGYLEEYKKFEQLYQHFIYEVAMSLKENKNSSYLKELKKILNNNVVDDYLSINKIKNIIKKIADKVAIANDNNKIKPIKTLKKNYKLTQCSKLSQKKCGKHPLCNYNNKKGCRLILDTKFWENLFINRLCETLLRNVLERNKILEAEYKPYFYQEEKLRLTDDEIFLTNETFYLIKQIYKSSKYHQEIDIFDTVEFENKQDRIIKVPYSEIFNKEIISYEMTPTSSGSSDDQKSDEKLELTGLSGVNKKKLKNVYATVFDKDGKYRSQYQAGPCIFPYVYGNTKQLFFNCNKDKDEGQRCPIEVDNMRRVLKWGFCPADPKETRQKHNVSEVFAKATNQKGKIEKGFKSGKCVFPFRYHPSYDLSWDCVTTKHGSSQKWCATGLKTGKHVASELPIAADKDDRIYQKKWDWTSMYDSKNNFNDDFLRYQNRGYCPSEEKNKKEDGKYINQELNQEITIDNFSMNKCHQTDSKGGYSKAALKKFAIKYLNFEESDLEGVKKELLCQLIGEKISDIRTKTNMNGKTLLNIYKKDPKMCEKGESGGGYYLGTLRKLAARYFGMDPEIARDASKRDLCTFIVPILDKELLKVEKEKPEESVVLSSIYTKNPNYCEEGPRKGGYGLKELKEMGVKYFGIDPELNNKDMICQIIRKKLQDEKNKTIEDVYEISDENIEEDDDSFSFLKDFKSFKKTKKNNRRLKSGNSDTDKSSKKSYSSFSDSNSF
jgi:hypothetical protein